MKDFNGKVVVTDKRGAEGVHEKAALFARNFFIKMRQGTGAAREVKAS
jgi:hypothetical protein